MSLRSSIASWLMTPEGPRPPSRRDPRQSKPATRIRRRPSWRRRTHRPSASAFRACRRRLPRGATKTNASTPSAKVAETIPDPTAVGPGSQTVAGTTQSLVPVATGGLTASLDAPMMEMRALLVGSQVAPAMITPMSRSLASAGEAGSARPVQASATAGNLDADAGEAKNDVDAPLATSEPTKATTSVAVDASGTAHRQATIAGLGGSDMAAMLPAPQSRTSPMAALIDAVASMAAQVPDDTTSASSGIALARTMTLQINPGNSGTVSIRMRLIGRGARPETLRVRSAHAWSDQPRTRHAVRGSARPVLHPRQSRHPRR